ncbi:putative class I-like SAM-dependent O-methyltransferase [Helianthus annuus]|nr:putative class I-like SAM-dependent O-methyltransferase [Helianthus annuus]KAJ0705673.1 putative class I-like SAM-dependent O-methyltransferase [Helianthus annuus]
MNRESYEIGRPVIEKAEVEHKVEFIESEALPALDKLLENTRLGSCAGSSLTSETWTWARLLNGLVFRFGLVSSIFFKPSLSSSRVAQLVCTPSFDFAYVDADKINYINYHERLMKLLKVNGIVVYDNTLWFGSVAQPESSVLDEFKEGRVNTINFNKSLADDPRINITMVPLGDGITICRRLY